MKSTVATGPVGDQIQKAGGPAALRYLIGGDKDTTVAPAVVLTAADRPADLLPGGDEPPVIESDADRALSNRCFAFCTAIVTSITMPAAAVARFRVTAERTTLDGLAWTT